MKKSKYDKALWVTDRTKIRIMKYGNYGENMDTILNRLVDIIEGNFKGEKK